MKHVLIAAVAVILLAGCNTTQPFLVDGNPTVCRLCGTEAISEHLYYAVDTRLDTECAFCPRCKVGIDTPGMLDKAEAELISKGLR